MGEGLYSATTSEISMVHMHDPNTSLPEIGRSTTQQERGEITAPPSVLTLSKESTHDLFNCTVPEQ